MSFKRTKVLVLGAGYAGIQAVSKMQSKLSRHTLDVTLINKNEFHYESTWLHEVAAGAIEWHHATYSINHIVDTLKTNFVQATVTAIDKEAKKVQTTAGEFDYDVLVVALGFESESFGIQGMDDHAHTIVSPETAISVWEEINKNFNRYLESGDENDLSIVVGGGGFTGFEFLGELSNTIPELCKELGIDRNKVKITAIEAMPKVLPMFPEHLADYAKNFLKENQIELMTGTAITAANEEGLMVKVDEEERLIPGATRVWTAGVRGNKLMEESFEGVKRGRIIVKPDLTIEGHPEIFVIGDCAAAMNGEGEGARPYPTTAQIAMQMGELTATNVGHIVKGEKTEAFKFNDRGTVCSLGIHDGIGVALGREVTGRRAAMLKRIIDTRAIFKVGGPILALSRGKLLNI